MTAGRSALRIGCASGFWGDSDFAARQLVDEGDIDFLVFDYLSEITMSILARMKAKDPSTGYVTDFVRTLEPLLPILAGKGIRVVSNAGGLNPGACGEALRSAIASAGLDLSVAVVFGDDFMRLAGEIGGSVRELSTGAALPAKLLSANAYLGAKPIAEALDLGASIVITGRCVDSAVALGPLVHHFGWGWTDYDRLAQGSLAGHIIECGTQATGGLFTDWEVVPGWDDMGFPVVVCEVDGSFIVTMPEGKGGLVAPATVAEQIVYEIGDPSKYLLPDVTCDFRNVSLSQVGPNQVRVTGAKGCAPSGSYKVCATFPDGFRLTATMMIGGFDAARKGERVAAAVLTRLRRLFAERGWPDFDDTSVEILGAEAMYGPHAVSVETREVIVKLAARHTMREALELLSREWFPAAAAMSPGISGVAGGRPVPTQVVRLFSFLVDKALVPATITYCGVERPVEELPSRDGEPEPAPSVSLPIAAVTFADEGALRVPLIRIAHGRSGDKGDCANIGLIARKPAFYPLLLEQVTSERVAEHFSHLARGPVTRYCLPGFDALNFVLERALGGGGVASLRYDPQGKAFAQILLAMLVDVPQRLLRQ